MKQAPTILSTPPRRPAPSPYWADHMADLPTGMIECPTCRCPMPRTPGGACIDCASTPPADDDHRDLLPATPRKPRAISHRLLKGSKDVVRRARSAGLSGQRVLLIALVIDGKMTQQAAAQALGIHPGTATRWIQQALDRIAEQAKRPQE
jgi:predicted DNA-binding protein (UPF0251 family)